MRKLNRQQALDLIQLVVDDEVNERDKKAFLKYIEKDEAVSRKYRSLLKFKTLIRQKSVRAKAPDHLKTKVHQLIEQEKQKQSAGENLDLESNAPLQNKDETQENNEQNFKSDNNINSSFYRGRSRKILRFITATAAVLILSFLTIDLLERMSPLLEPSLSLEEYAFTHFIEDNESISTASIGTASLADAQNILTSEYNLSPRIPEIDGANIASVIYSDFVPEFKTPMLEYYQEEIDEYIYVFTFNLDSLKSFEKLVRDPEAIDQCKTYDDFHIRDVNGKHVVSWKWGDYWYAAISNHNGNDLAGLVQPMDSSW